ncbi:MAG: glycoside hydrolase family 38 C-terminal domain-containing protein [Promethearchaeota archaeon]
MENSKINVFIAPHFHYDWCWCDTPDGMGAKGAKIIKEALKIMRKYPDYKFVIDSAMAVEYFKLHYPDMMDELKKRVNENKIELIGGMIIAPDTLLPNGESLVRQILYGSRYFKENFKINSKIGYLLDSFGQTPQLPQILKKAGFKYFIFNRGARNRNLPQEFLWKALDGSKILTHWMASSYAYIVPPFSGAIFAPFFPFLPIPGTLSIIPHNFKVYEILKKIFPPIKYIFQKLSLINKGIPILDTDMGCGLKYTIKNRIKKTTTNNILILYGMDNTPPSSIIIDAVDYLQKTNDNYNTQISLPSEFLKAVVNTRKRFGIIESYEFNGFPDKFPGTFSNRIKLKQKIRMLENQYYLTELIATLSSLISNYKYPMEDITKAIWRILCCDFHDGICGCHVDAAYNTIMKMLRLTEFQLKKIYNNALNILIKSVDSSNLPKTVLPLFIFNPLSCSRTDIVKFNLPNDNDKFNLKDEKGNYIPFQKSHLNRLESEYICIIKDIPSISYKLYYLEQDISVKSAEFKETFEIKYGKNKKIIEIENKRFCLTFENNKLISIRDKTNNFTLQGSDYFINDLRIFNDRGDSYLHGKMPNKIFTTYNSKLDIIEKGPVRIVIRIKSYLQCKAKWFFKPINEIIQYIIVYNFDISRIDFCTKFKNKIKNIRIQACFPVNFENAIFHSEVPYGYIERDISPRVGKSWSESNKRFSHYDRIFPVINWMDVSNYNEKKGFAIINDGLPEYEIDKNKNNLFITLLKSTGFLSSLFPRAVPMSLGPFYSIPKALELSDQEFYYSIYFHDGDLKSNYLSTRALCHNIPLITKQIEIQGGNLHSNRSFIKIEPENFLIRVIKKAEDNNNEIIIRAIETSNCLSKGRMTFDYDLKKVYLVNLLEKPIKELAIENNNSFTFNSKNQEILTFLVQIS